MAEPLDRLVLPLAALMRWFTASGLRAAIIGGVAASLRGTPRLTKDIDAVVLDADAEALIRSGASFEFFPRIADAAAFAAESRMVLMRFSKGDIDVDLSLQFSAVLDAEDS